MAHTCKGECRDWKKKPVHRHPFNNNKICRTCDVYYPLGSDAGSANVCFCCKCKLGIKPKRNKSNCKREVPRY